MSQRPVDLLLERLEAAGCAPKRNGSGWSARCPAHEDTNPSLTIGEGADATGLLTCWAGCARDAVIAELGLSWTDLFPPRQEANGRLGEPEATYDYTDADGILLFQVVRFPGKQFRQRRPEADGWTWNLNGVERVLYHLPSVLFARGAGETVWVVEGERDVHAMEAAGAFATTNPGGAGKWRPAYTETLAGAEVVVVADADETGHRHALEVVQSLRAAGCKVQTVEPAVGKDAADHLAAGFGIDAFVSVDLSPKAPHTPDAPAATTPSSSGWPTLDIDALYGLVGEVVRTIDPHTEADRVAVLVQYLAMFGSAVGRGPHFVAEAHDHYTNLFITLAGITAKGRKGSSLAQVRRIFDAVDEVWTRDRVVHGLSTGEGLIWAVRDEIRKTKPVMEKGRPTGEHDEYVEDPGVTDKRLLAVEEELASLLKLAGREGNNLSAILRKAWDGSTVLSTLTKNSPAKATDSHVSLVGHITREELRRHLDNTEAANGFGNRFAWFAVKRSKSLPRGGNLSAQEMSRLQSRTKRALAFAEGVGVMHRDEEADDFWDEIYAELSEGQPGLLGAVTGRAEAQTMRFAMLYALLDESAVIRLEHLKAGHALWRYAEASARWIFGDSLGDPVADQLLRALRAAPGGLTRTQITVEVFGKHRKAPEIDQAVTSLMERGLISSTLERTDGRSAERWCALPQRAKEAKDAKEGRL